MNLRFAIVALGAAALLSVVSSAAYTVSEVEQVVITQFGEPMGSAITEPGLHWKLPFVQNINRFDKRWLEWDGAADEMPTHEKTYIWVDSYARWRIIDPLKFMTSVRDERGAQSRLDDIIDSETRNVIAAHRLIEVVRSSNRAFAKSETNAVGEETEVPAPIQDGRAKVRQQVLEKAQVAMPDYGIELVDVQFQRVNYTESVEKKVFERMISERKRIADLYRSQGEGERNFTLGKKERELLRIESEAYRQVQEIKGKADAEAAATYAKAYKLDPKLYRLLKSLESYGKTIDDSTVILSTDSEFLQPLVSGGR